MEREPNQVQQAIRQNYENHAETNNNKLERQVKNTFHLKAFNNWIKAVLIQSQTKRMCKKVQQTLDLRKGDGPLLHVLDIGCGRGQDINKWRLARVSYMVVVDFSPECVKTYEQRWKYSKQPYRLYSVVGDFTSNTLYSQIEHSYYDLISAQFCFHYMLGTQKGLHQGLVTILSNLLIGGVFIATIPDSYTILRKIKEKGITQDDGSRVYGNRYFSIRFQTTQFIQPFNNMYGFYLEDAVGSKNQNGEITYTNQWLIQLDFLSKVLQNYGVVIEESINFLEYYVKYREEYKDLFPKFKLIFNEGQSMDPELWDIAHLYRVLICRKKSKGKSIEEFNLDKRKKSIAQKQIRGNFNRQGNQRNHSYDGQRHRPNGSGYQNRGDHSRNRDNNYENKDSKRHY